MQITESRFLGLDCIRLANNKLSLLVTQSVGPRVLSLKWQNGPNLLAELPHFTTDCPGVGTYHFWGGHRLWHAPEVRRRTYIPDNQPVEIIGVDGALQITQAVEVETGIQKSWHLRLAEEGGTVIIDHTLTNHNLWPVECAPWAITQLQPGGVAILPQFTGLSDSDGLQPNRTLALWPYTDINSPHITWGNEYIFIHAKMTQGALKIGWPNLRQWLAYYWQKTLFVKRATFDPQAFYYDGGSSSQCYCNPDFLELETLAPRTTLQPGGSVSHRESWHLFGPLSSEPSEIAAQLDDM